MPAQIKTDLRDVQKKFGLLRGTLAGLRQGVAEGLFHITRESFQKQASPEGAPWTPLSPRYSALKARLFPGKPILQARGALLRSLYRQVSGRQIIVGSNLPHAAAHNWGFLGSESVKAHTRRVKGRDVFETTSELVEVFGTDEFGDETSDVRRRKRRRKIASGLGQVKAHQRKMRIPARPFLPKPETAEREAARLADEILQDAIRKHGAG